MLSLEKVLKGIQYHEEVLLPFYEEKVEIRPLSDSEFAEARRRSGVIKIAGAIERAKAEHPDETMNDMNLDLIEVDASVSALHLAVAEMGLVDPELRKNASKLMGGSLQIIGDAIINLTTAARNEILNFSTQTKENP
jgi:hypothetical protein